MGPLPRLLEQARGLLAVERVFRAEGLPLWLAHDQSSNLPVRCLTGLIERAAREIGDDLFGVNLGHAMQPEDFGPVIQCMASATNIGDLLRAIGSRLALSHVWSRVQLCAPRRPCSMGN